MANTIVLGMQWGDEGKGKIVDLLCPAFDSVVRFQGGNNAGHTVKFGDQHFALHLLPSGILHDGVRCVLANGMVITPDALFEELDNLSQSGIEASDRLFVSDRAHLILPSHCALDIAREAARGSGKIGTTGRGIGPAYETKAARCGVRAGDLLGADLAARLEVQQRQIAPQLEALGAEPMPSIEALVDQCRAWGERLAPFLANTPMLLNRWMAEGKSVLFEGAQGALLDLDHGTYPYVTSSNATAGGAAAGAGVAPNRFTGTLGVIKAYTTRVGAGPFVSELLDSVGEHLRRRGNEFGTTTGRPRRCGWFDAVVARHSVLLNGVEALAVTKLDVLDELDTLEVCVGYRYRGEVLEEFPTDLEILAEAEPVYRTMPGWKTSTVGVLDFDELPRAARDYLSFLEDQLEAPVCLVSTGPRREETLFVDHPNLQRLLEGHLDRVIAERDATQ